MNLTQKIEQDFTEVHKAWIISNWHKATPSPVESYLHYGISDELRHEYHELDTSNANDEIEAIHKRLRIVAREVEAEHVQDDNRGIVNAIIGDYGFTRKKVSELCEKSAGAVVMWFMDSPKQTKPRDSTLSLLRQKLREIDE